MEMRERKQLFIYNCASSSLTCVLGCVRDGICSTRTRDLSFSAGVAEGAWDLALIHTPLGMADLAEQTEHGICTTTRGDPKDLFQEAAPRPDTLTVHVSGSSLINLDFLLGLTCHVSKILTQRDLGFKTDWDL
jgi:hypothetical protein